MTHLDEEFKKQDAEELRSLLSKQVWQTYLECEQSLISEKFEGEMRYATVCRKCSVRSERSATFLELEINLKVAYVIQLILNG